MASNQQYTTDATDRTQTETETETEPTDPAGGDGLIVSYDDLWFIKTRSADDKRAKEAWGGYSQDYEAADCVYTHEEVVQSRETNWGIVGIQNRPREPDRSLLVIDIDIHKAPDSFDASRITVPENTLIVRSQNGGLHVYFTTWHERGAGKESDFDLTADLPGDFDIDIRGSYVNHHVCAPRDIPGVGGRYDVVQNERVLNREPDEAAAMIRFDGEPLLECTSGYGGDTYNGSYERQTEPPEDMPQCYHAALELRHAAPEDHPNTHQVNTMAALCGLAAGYEIDELVEHFCQDYPPGDQRMADESQTRYQLELMANKMDRDSGGLKPPAISTLQELGILRLGEACDGEHCEIEYHGAGYGHTPECPSCQWALGDHCRVETPAGETLWECSQCRETWATEEVMPDE